MEFAILFIITSLLTTVTLSSPISNENEEIDPQTNLQDVLILSPDEQIQEIEELSHEHAVENLDPEKYDLTPPEEGESMHTAENLVFRPLFSYRKIQEKKKRLYGSRKPSTTTSSPNALRRSQIVYYSQPQPTRYVYPYEYNQNYQNYQTYPAYYSGNYYPITYY